MATEQEGSLVLPDETKLYTKTWKVGSTRSNVFRIALPLFCLFKN